MTSRWKNWNGRWRPRCEAGRNRPARGAAAACVFASKQGGSVHRVTAWKGRTPLCPVSSPVFRLAVAPSSCTGTLRSLLGLNPAARRSADTLPGNPSNGPPPSPGSISGRGGGSRRARRLPPPRRRRGETPDERTHACVPRREACGVCSSLAPLILTIMRKAKSLFSVQAQCRWRPKYYGGCSGAASCLQKSL